MTLLEMRYAMICFYFRSACYTYEVHESPELYFLSNQDSYLRITEWFGLKWTFKDNLVRPPAMGSDIFH